MAGAHRFEAGIRKLLRSRGATAVPAVVRDLDGIASVFLTGLLKDPLLSLSSRRGDRRTVGRDDVLAAATIQLFGGLRQRALTDARGAARNTPAG
ncbi:hypothetical protein GCM10010360_18630 [Streptomyces nogalater]